MALQAFIDDSVRGQDPAFVLAGWIASPEQWAELSDEWKRILNQSPRIEYFKMREAWCRQEQFSGWEITDRNDKVAALYAAIERFAMKGINIALPSVVFKNYASLVNHRKANNPYFLASFTMMVMISQLKKDAVLSDRWTLSSTTSKSWKSRCRKRGMSLREYRLMESPGTWASVPSSMTTRPQCRFRRQTYMRGGLDGLMTT